MTKALACSFLLFVISIPGFSQNWLEQVLVALNDSEVTISLNDYYHDIKILDKLNSARQEFNADSELKQITPDTLGLYGEVKGYINNSANTVERNQETADNETHIVQLTYQNSGEITVASRLVNELLIKGIMNQESESAIKSWFKKDKSGNLSNDISTGAAGGQLQLHFKKKGTQISIQWEYISTFIFKPVPESLARSKSEK